MQTSRKSYVKPPVIEAVIDLRFAQTMEGRTLERIQNNLQKKYPAVENQISFSLALNPNQTTLSQRPSGWKLSSSDSLDVVILQPGGIASARLPPYNG